MSCCRGTGLRQPPSPPNSHFCANLAGRAVIVSIHCGSGAAAPLTRRHLVAQFQRAKPRGRPMVAHIAHGNATRARTRARVEHVFAAEKHRMGLVIRTIRQFRATAKITLADTAYNMRRLVWTQTAAVPA